VLIRTTAVLAFSTAGDGAYGLPFGWDVAGLQRGVLIYLGLSALAFVVVGRPEGLEADEALVSEATRARHLVHLRHLRRPPPALAGDNLELAGVIGATPDQNRLEHAFLGNRLRQFGEFVFPKVAARLEAARTKPFDRNQLRRPQPFLSRHIFAVVSE